MPKRPADALRPLHIAPHVLAHPAGSALISMGDTQVLCTASLAERVPPWLAGKKRGWVTAEYDMLPGATNSRKPRDSHRGKINGRSQEISRLLGRALRAAVNLDALGERCIVVDCDVLQADGGTRTAAITGGYVALAIACSQLVAQKLLAASPLGQPVAAVSVGLLADGPQLDLDYAMDARALVDANVVLTGAGDLVDLGVSGEQGTCSRQQLMALVDLAEGALPQLLAAQQAALAMPYRPTALGALGAQAATP